MNNVRNAPPVARSDAKWGVSSSAKLVSQPPRPQRARSNPHLHPQSQPPPSSHFMHTISPYESRKPQDQTQPLRTSQDALKPPRLPQHPPPPPPSSPSHPPHPSQSPKPRRRSHESSPSSPHHNVIACRRASEPPRQHRSSQPARRMTETPSSSVSNHQQIPIHDSDLRRHSNHHHHPQHQQQEQEQHSKPKRPVPLHPATREPSPDYPHKSPTKDHSISRPDSYIELSPARRRELISNMNKSVQNVMASMLSEKANPVQWKPKLRKNDISFYTDETHVKPGQTRFCCVTHSSATVEDIMKLFVVSDAESMTRNSRVLAENLLEARILSVLRWPTRERPMNSMYVRYSSYQGCGFMTDREVCVAVATDLIHQPDGSTIAYCLWDTVDGPEFASASKNLERCVMFRSGFFLRRSGRRHVSTDPSTCYTKIVYMIGLELGGWAPGLTARRSMERFGLILARLCAHFRRKQLDSRTFVMKTEWMPKHAAKACHVCQKHFQVLSKRVNCHACGHVSCRACVSKEMVELPAVGLVPMHICHACLTKAGLPTPHSSYKYRSSRGKKPPLELETTGLSRGVKQEQAKEILTKKHEQQEPKLEITQDVIEEGEEGEEEEEEEEEDDTDTGEWAFTLSGVPIRPYRRPK